MLDNGRHTLPSCLDEIAQNKDRAYCIIRTVIFKVFGQMEEKKGRGEKAEGEEGKGKSNIFEPKKHDYFARPPKKEGGEGYPSPPLNTKPSSLPPGALGKRWLQKRVNGNVDKYR